jgi:hypothetical protein
MPGTPVVNTTKSLVSRDGKRHQPSAQVVVHRSLTQTAKPSLENSIVILMAILQGITENTISGDVMALAMYRAGDLCAGMGITRDEFNSVMTRFNEFQRNARKGKPLAF